MFRQFALSLMFLLLVGSLVFSIGETTAQGAVEDSTCHNLYRDGRESLPPTPAHFVLEISIEQWKDIKDKLQIFATKQGLSYRDSSKLGPRPYGLYDLSLCNDRGFYLSLIVVKYPGIRVGADSIPFLIHETRNGFGWQDMTRSLISALNKSWPGKIKIIAAKGKLVPIPEALTPQQP